MSYKQTVLKDGRRDLRCPYCNVWDAHFYWECDVCYKTFIITQEAADWQKRKYMSDAMTKEETLKFLEDVGVSLDSKHQFENLSYDLCSVVEEFGGYEDAGPNCMIVYKLTNNGQIAYVRFDGAYDSWDGANWGTGEIVEPYQKTVTNWRAI